MDAATIVIIVVAVLVVAGLLYWASTRGRERVTEQRRERATEHREEARAQARDAGEAERMRQRAEELERKATDTDPDTKQ